MNDNDEPTSFYAQLLEDDITAAPPIETPIILCGHRQGTEVCDRINDHRGDCSWKSSIVIDMMAIKINSMERQLNEIYQLIQSLRPLLPPGVL